MAHVLGIVASVENGLPWSLRIVLVAVVAGNCFVWFRMQVLKRSNDTLVLGGDGQWQLYNRFGPEPQCLAGGSVVTRWLVILDLRSSGRPRRVLICRDSTDPESFRQLRAYLRTRPSTEDCV